MAFNTSSGENPFEQLQASIEKLSTPMDAARQRISAVSDKATESIAPLDALANRLALLQTATTKASQSVFQFQGPINSVNSAMRAMTETAVKPLTAGLNLFAAATTGTINLIQSFVAKANPSSAFQFNRALDDLAGTMGQILTPILDSLTVFIRAFADGLQGLRPALDPIMNGIGELIKALAPLAQALMQLTGPAFQLIGDILQNVVVPAVKLFADVLTDLVKLVMNLIENVSGGLVSFKEFEAKSSVGAAIRPAAYGKIEDIGKRTTLAALNIGRGDPQVAMLEEQKKTNSWLEKILVKTGVPQETAKRMAERNERSGGISAGIGVELYSWLRRQLTE